MVPFGYKPPPIEEIELNVQCMLYKISEIEYWEYWQMNHWMEW